MRKLLIPVLSASLIVSSTAATAATAPRAPSPVKESEEISGSPWLWIVLAAAALGVILILVTDDDDPESP